MKASFQFQFGQKSTSRAEPFTRIAVAIAIASAILGCGTPAKSVVQPVIFNLSTNSNYAVPVGKVLVIQTIIFPADCTSIAIQQDGSTNAPLQISTCNFATVMVCGPTAPALTLPLKIPGGWSLGFATNGIPSCSGNEKVWVFASLADTTDLYVALPNQIQNPSVASGQLSFDVRTPSTKPVNIQVQAEHDLTNGWQNVSSAIVSSTADKSLYSVSIPATGGREFVRTKVIQKNN